MLKDALEAHVDIHGALDLLGPEDKSASEPAAQVKALASADAEVPDAEVPDGNVPDGSAPDGNVPAAMAPGPEATPVSENAISSPAPSAYDRIEALIPADSPLHGFSTLAEVEKWVAATELIELDRTRTKPVFGVGSPNADLLVIGEAPGKDEDLQGEPFVGRAGKLLTQILEAIGFKRKDVYIANILKSRPDNNRDPRPDEIAAHVPILYKQMVLIRPKLILCVGKTSGNSLLGGKHSLKSMRGAFQDFHGLEVLVTYHPAALLRNPNWKRPTWEDVQLLRSRYDELTGA
ncbi:MAG: uracil-DNA glycosylase family 4 [Rhodothermales bacterium]